MTWYQELERKNPRMAHAYSIVGANQPKWALRNMVRALTMMPALNTRDDKHRLAAAKRILAGR